MNLDEWNDLLDRSSEGTVSDKEVEELARDELSKYFNRFPESMQVDDCDLASIRAGRADDIEITVVKWQSTQANFTATLNFKYPATSSRSTNFATRRVEMDRSSGAVLVLRSVT